MEFDFSKLLGRIVEKFGTRSAFAAELGLADSVLSSRLSNKVYFNAEEIHRSCEILDIDPQDIPVYFFAVKVR
jgi:hypothetical protein